MELISMDAPVTDGTTPTEAPPEGVILAVEAFDDGWRNVDDIEFERKLCIGAIPVMLVVALLFHATDIGSFIQRIMFGMPVHEVGHAMVGWFSGYSAIPTFWKTLVPDSRGFIAPFILGGAVGYLLYQAYLARKFGLLIGGGVLVVLQLVGTFFITPQTARMLITFGGDGLGMVLATVLMMTFFFGKSGRLYVGGVRWGTLGIGAAAFVDMYGTWWAARSDVGAVPFGLTGGQPTDSLKLVDNYGWSMHELINRYFAVGIICLIALAVVYAWGVWHCGQRLEERERAERREALLQRSDGGR
jgi:hypothetical protein